MLDSDARRAHHRNAAFMVDFERLATGHGPSEAPSFLERARNRWSARAEHDGQEDCRGTTDSDTSVRPAV